MPCPPGAREVIPCAEVETARQIARKFPPSEVVLGGERGGLAVEGFDLGNSPEDYTAARLSGKTLVITDDQRPPGRWPMPKRRRRFFWGPS